MGYNSEAVKFQYDFLNDDYTKLPESLRKAIEEGRKIIVLMNPPYATSSNMVQGTSKKGVGDTVVNQIMKQNVMGDSAKQLYAQFLYKIHSFSGNINIGMFSNPSYLTGEKFSKFREVIMSDYDFKGGFVMDASNFADVKSWGLTFSILSNKK
jgi:hypothetical protein